MFKTTQRQCANRSTHFAHRSFEGFFDSVICRGVHVMKKHDDIIMYTWIKGEEYQPEIIPLPEKAKHKHKFKLTDVGFSGDHQGYEHEHNKVMAFRCFAEGCPFTNSHYGLHIPCTIQVPRWKYREMTLTPKSIDQNWPE